MAGEDEAGLLAALRDMDRQWRRVNPTGHGSTRIWQMVETYGVVGMAKRVANENFDWVGFATIFETRRFDLTVEWLVLRERFRPLFDDDDRQRARERLAQRGCIDLGADAVAG